MIINVNFIGGVGYYAIRMNDHYNMVIHVQEKRVSVCGAREVDNTIHTDTNSNSLWRFISHDVADELVRTFGARFFNESYFDVNTQVRIFNL